MTWLLPVQVITCQADLSHGTIEVMSRAGETQRSHLFASVTVLHSAIQPTTHRTPSEAHEEADPNLLSPLLEAPATAASRSPSAVCSMSCSSQLTSGLDVSAIDGAMQLSSALLQPPSHPRDGPWLRIPSGWAACRVDCSAADGAVNEVGGLPCALPHGMTPEGLAGSLWSTAVLDASHQPLEQAGCLSAEAQLRRAPVHGPLCHMQGLDLRPVIPVRTYGPSPTTALQTPRTPR